MNKVPEDLQSILNDTTLFNNTAEITTKEILKRYADIRKRPANLTPYSQNPAKNQQPQTASMPGSLQHSSTDPTSNSYSVPSNGSAQVVSRVDDPAYQPSASRAETRGPGIRSKSRGPTPPPYPAPANGFYSNTPSGSRDSFGGGRTASPARYPGRAGPNAPHGPPGGQYEGVGGMI